MNMPKMVPLPIQTKGESFCVRIYRWLFSPREWKLLEDWTFQLPEKGLEIVIPEHFVFNGASVPRPLWVFLTPTGLLFIPGLVHDFAYKYGCLWALKADGRVWKYGKDMDRFYWDKVFGEVGRDVNGMAWVTVIAQFALFVCGWRVWRRHRKARCQPPKPSTAACYVNNATP